MTAHTTCVLTTLLTGLFTLVGVSLGALLEPVRAAAGHRARARQERIDRCTRLIEAAITTRSLLLEINYLHRRAEGGVLDGSTNTVFDQYRAARSELKKVVALIQMTGPDDLANSAAAVREADRRLRATRMNFDADSPSPDRDATPETVQQAANEFERTVTEFAVTARKYA